MSTGYGGSSNKGKDGKFHTINLTSTYKGRSTEAPKSTSTIRHGLQSLGKVQNVRRVPPPASLPSLKSENLGNDPNIALVPKDGTGWGSKSDPKSASASSNAAGVVGNQQQTQETQQTRQRSQQQQHTTYATAYSSSNQHPPGGARGQQQSSWGRFQQHNTHRAGRSQGRISEDFPSLSNTRSQQENETDLSKEPSQLGSGPSLRPQNVASWREGGGRNVPQIESDEIRKRQSQTPDDSRMIGSTNEQGIGAKESGYHDMGQTQYRGGVNDYAPYGRYPNNMPSNNRYPPPDVNMGPQSQGYPAQDSRNRGPYMDSRPPQKRDPYGGPHSIVSHAELQDLDHIGKESNEGWADMQGDVDYSEKLVFSDEDEQSDKEKKENTTSSNDRGNEHSRPKEESRPMPPRQAWGQQTSYGHHDQNWGQQSYHQPQGYPQGPRGPSPASRGKPYEGRIPPQGQAHPGAPQSRYNTQMHPPPHHKPYPSENDGYGRVRDDKSAAAERARRRREEEEKRMSHQHSVDAKPDPYYDVGRYDGPHQPHSLTRTPSDEYRQYDQRGRRTESESSDDRRKVDEGHYQRSMPPHAMGGNRNLPPRLAHKKQETSGRQWYQTQQSTERQQWAQGPSGYSQADHRTRPPAIMKRDRTEDGVGQEKDFDRSRKASESSARSHHSGRATPADKENERPPQDRRITPHSRDYSRHGDLKDGHRRDNMVGEEAPPPPREPKLWEPPKTEDKRSTAKRQARESSSSNASEKRPHQQKPARNDSKPVTKSGSSHSDRGSTCSKGDDSRNRYQRDQPRDPAKSRHEMSRDKMKFKDFRVEENGDDELANKRDPNRRQVKGRNDRNKEESVKKEPRTWSKEPATKTEPVKTNVTQERKEETPKPKPDLERKASDSRSNRSSSTPDNAREQRSYTKQTSRNEDRRGPRYSDRRDDRRDDKRERRHETQHYDVRQRQQLRSKEKKPEAGPRPQSQPQEPTKAKEEKPKTTTPEPAKSTNEKPSTPLVAKLPTVPAKLPGTNVWEERMKKNEVETEKVVAPAPAAAATFVPTQGDKKKTLGETAPKRIDGRQSEPKKPNADLEKVLNDKNLEAERRMPAIRQESYRGRRGSRPPRSNRFADRQFDEPRGIGSRGRGRSRGGSYSRGGLSRGGHSSYYDRTSSAAVRGRGTRRPRRGMRSAPPRGSVGDRRPRQRESDYDDSSETDEYTDEETEPMRSRKREVGDPSDGYTDDTESYSENEDVSPPRTAQPQKKPPVAPTSALKTQSSREAPPREKQNGAALPETSDSSRPRERPTRGRGGSTPFMARGEPSRRGRGRGMSSGPTRGRGRGISSRGGARSAPPNQWSGRGRRYTDSGPNQSYQASNERDEKRGGISNGIPTSSSGRPPRGTNGRGGVARDFQDRRRKPKAKEDSRPPRFQRLDGGRGREDDQQASNKAATNGSSEVKKADTEAPSPLPHRSVENKSPFVDGVCSSDLGAEEWETASDASHDHHDYVVAQQEVNEPVSEHKPSRQEDKPPSHRGGYQERRAGRGRGRGSNHDRSSHNPRSDHSNNFVGNNNHQVYVVHTVDYANPGAINEALRDAKSNNEEGGKANKKAKQNEELFKLYDLGNYASIVNADDLPDVSHRDQQALELLDFIPITVDKFPHNASPDLMDDDGFTQVLSKRELRKREQLRKKEEEKVQEMVRKAKLEQQKQQRQRFFNKTPGSPIGGSSGAIKQSAELKKSGDNLWTSEPIGTWDPSQISAPSEEIAIVNKDGKPDNPSSQHDSGVESSVPSSQRSSPGSADPKISFSNFGTVSTTTGVITSVRNGKLPSVIHMIPELEAMKPTPEYHQAGLPDTGSSPRSVGSNPAGAIGGERGKRSVDPPIQMEPPSLDRLQGGQLDAIHSYLPGINDKNQISFVAEPADAKSVISQSIYKSDAEFSPFGKEPDATSARNTGYPGMSTFQSDTEVEIKLDSDASFPQFCNPSPNPSPLNELSQDHNVSPTRSRLEAVQQTAPMGNYHQMQNLPQSAISSSVLGQTSNKEMDEQSGARTGSNPHDMNDSPNLDNVNAQHVGANDSADVLPRVQPSSELGLRVQSSSNDMSTRSQNPNDIIRGQGSNELGLHGQSASSDLKGQSSTDVIHLAPTSPSADFNLKMESARKAWENTSSAYMPADVVEMQQNQQQAKQAMGGTGAPFPSFHPSTHQVAATESISKSIDTIVTESNEWKPQGSATVVDGAEGQSSESNPASVTTAPSSVGSYTSDSQSTARSASQVVQQQSHMSVMSPYFMLGMQRPEQSSTFLTSQTRMPVQQASPYQPISSASLHNNLQQMQQAHILGHIPDYPVIGSYNSLAHHTAYNTPQQREYQTSLFLQTSVVTPAVKAQPLNTMAVKPQTVTNRNPYAATAQGMNMNLGMAHRSMTNQITAAGSLSPVAAAPVFVPNLSQRSTSTFPSHQANQVSGFYTAQAVARPQTGQAAYQQPTHGPQFQLVNKGSSPSPLTSEPMIGASGNMVAPSPAQTGVIGGSYATIAPPGQQRRSDDFGYMQSPFLQKMNYSAKTQTTQPQDPMRTNQYPQQYLMGTKMSSSPAANTSYSMPQSLQSQGNLNPSTQPLRFTQSQSQMKSFQPVDQTERVKQMNQYRQVQGILSRPYTGDIGSPSMGGPQSTSFMPSRTPDALGQMPPQAATGQMPPQFNPNQMGPRSMIPTQWNAMQGGKPPQQMGVGRPPIDMMGKPQPRMQMTPQRFMPPQQYQAMPQQHMAGARPGMQFRLRMQQNTQQMPPSFGTEFYPSKPPMPTNQPPNKGRQPVGAQGQLNQQNKVPPVPSLVRGAHKMLDPAKKTQYIPMEKVKEQQTEGRMNLLSSVQSFFKDGKPKEGDAPDPRKLTDDDVNRPRPGRRTKASKNAAARSSMSNKAFGKFDPSIQPSPALPETTPIPDASQLTIEISDISLGDAVSPGAADTGASAANQAKRTGPIGGLKPQNEPANPPPEAPIRKMTLADTRPKKGETVQIPLNE